MYWRQARGEDWSEVKGATNKRRFRVLVQAGRAHGVLAYVDGKPVGIVVFDSPKSFRHPTTWHARAYGLLAANPFAAREFAKDDNKDGSWTIPEKKSLTFRYRVVVYDGQLTAGQLTDMYRTYAETQK